MSEPKTNVYRTCLGGLGSGVLESWRMPVWWQSHWCEILHGSKRQVKKCVDLLWALDRYGSNIVKLVHDGIEWVDLAFKWIMYLQQLPKSAKSKLALCFPPSCLGGANTNVFLPSAATVLSWRDLVSLRRMYPEMFPIKSWRSMMSHVRMIRK